MKKILKFILSKYHKFWTPVAIALLGLAFYASRFFENFIEDYVPHLSAIAIALLVIAFVMLILGVAVDWSRTDYRANDQSLKDVDEAKNTGENPSSSPIP
jgi:undecaprenyl pyrophosphate phosphatase UppP